MFIRFPIRKPHCEGGVAINPKTKLTRIQIGGMTCVNCEQILQKLLTAIRGVRAARVDYRTGYADIEYNPDETSLTFIKKSIDGAGYSVPNPDKAASSGRMRTAGLLLVIIAAYFLLSRSGILTLLVPDRLAETDMGYGMLFLVGLLTSVHCIAMCGGINLSQTIGQTSVKPSLLYNLGRVISYTAVGFIVGALGSVISFSTTAQGILKLVAGGIMVGMGINLLGIFPALRKFTLRLPRIRLGTNSPFLTGLLNGLMPCGPLQAMQVYALSTGSPLKGALSMLLFSLGTVPLMFGFGALASVLSKKHGRQIMAVGSILVVVLGLSMFSQGWNLSNASALFAISERTSGSDHAVLTDGVQVVTSTLAPGSYPVITVTAGIPVRWVITAPDGSINGCNDTILIPEYGIEYRFKKGENIIEFTPSTAGSFRYSCWMGMIPGTIEVQEAK